MTADHGRRAMTADAWCAARAERARQAGADAAQVALTTHDRFEIDVLNGAIRMVQSTRDQTVGLTVFRDGKRGAAAVNGCGDEAGNGGNDAAFDDALAAALAAADAGLADPANDIADAASEPPSDHGPADADRDAMIARMADCLDELAQRHPRIRCSGGYAFEHVQRAFANSRGVVQRARHAFFGFGMSFVAKDAGATSSASGSGTTSFTPFERLLDAGITRRVLDEVERSLDAKPVPQTFVGDVILTPECLAGFVGMLAGALSGNALQAGTTPYKQRQGERIAAPCFSLLNRPRAPDFPGGTTFDAYGVPTRDLDVVRDGVLADFLVDFQMARRLGRRQTAGASNFVVPSGETPLADIIAGTKRGVLLCRFAGGAPNAHLDFSGVAKGSFYVENGAVTHPLTETMVSGNLQDLLMRITAVSRDSVNFGDGRYPYLAAGGVTISSKR